MQVRESAGLMPLAERKSARMTPQLPVAEQRRVQLKEVGGAVVVWFIRQLPLLPSARFVASELLIEMNSFFLLPSFYHLAGHAVRSLGQGTSHGHFTERIKTWGNRWALLLDE